MERAKIDRINELAKIAKERELTAEEAAERQALRGEYLASVRENFRGTLENVRIVDNEGNQRPLVKTEELKHHHCDDPNCSCHSHHH